MTHAALTPAGAIHRARRGEGKWEASPSMSIRIDGFTFSYGSSRVLDGVSLAAARPGELLGIVGPNAAGKSTLLKCVAGLLCASGQIWFDGEEVRTSEQWRRLRRQVTYLPQEYASTAAITVFEAVLVARQQTASWVVGDDDVAAVATILDDLRLEPLALRYLSELSGGQRQMVAVAQALAREPRVLLLDEPTSSLDLQRQLELLQLVRRLTAERSMTVLIALHDLNLAARFVDRLAVLHQGRSYAEGLPAEVLTEMMLWQVYGIEARVERDSDDLPRITPIRSVRDRETPADERLLAGALA
jgi:iron complex transport system ATP-binding protein